jgi:hypothetical protein
VQALPSLQGRLLFVLTQPELGLQLSVVHTLPSSGQLSAAPLMQAPPLQVSLVVQALLSLQGRLLFVLTQPELGSHVSVVQTLPSSGQLSGGPPRQAPAPLQVSLVVQALLSLQGVPVGWKLSPGQMVPPLHVSATSHAPAEERQTVPTGLWASSGHAGLVPLHVSGTSHVVGSDGNAARQTKPDGLNWSAGQSLSVLLQNSAGSHPPVEARHWTPSFLESGGQKSPCPSQNSGRSQTPAAARQVVPAGFLLSGQSAVTPLQKSSASQVAFGAAARQSVPAGFGLRTQTRLTPLQVCASQGPSPAPLHTVPAGAGRRKLHVPEMHLSCVQGLLSEQLTSEVQL